MVYVLSLENIKNTFGLFLNRGFSKEETISITVRVPNVFSYSFDSVNKKLDVLRSVSLEDEVVKRPSYLIQGVDLSYARVKYLKSHNVVLNHKVFNYLVLSNKEFLKKFGISNDDVRKKYSYGK